MIPSITPQKADAMVDAIRDVLDTEALAVVKALVTSRRPPLRARDEWREIAEKAAIRLTDRLHEVKPWAFVPREAQSAVNEVDQRYLEATAALRKLFWDFYDLTFTKANSLPDGTDYNKAVKSEVKAWALMVQKAVKGFLALGVEFTQLLLALPDPYKNQKQPDSIEEFQISGLRFVVFDEAAVKLTPLYADKAERAFAALRAKGFSKVWYGTVLIKSADYKMLNDFERDQYRALGYENLESTAGSYHSGADEVVFTTSPYGFTSTLVHELGHRWWYKMLDRSQRARFNDLIQTNRGTNTREWPSGPTDEDGLEKPVTPVSNYGKSTIEEAFAEAFTHYVLGLDMNNDQAESFRSVLHKQAGSVYSEPWPPANPTRPPFRRGNP